MQPHADYEATTPQLFRDQLFPYLVELQYCLNQASAHHAELLSALDRAAEARTSLEGVDIPTIQLVGPALEGNREVYEALEAFCGPWARSSLLLFPAKGGWKARGQALRQLWRLDETHPLSDRDFRDSWAHFDERLDAKIRPLDFTMPQGQAFMLERHITAAAKERILRLVAVDTGVLYYHDRAGAQRSRPLRPLGVVLDELRSGMGDAMTHLGEFPEVTAS